MAISRKRIPNKREKLGKAAIKEFAKNGITHTSISKIAKAAGVATGTFYSYYQDKETLFEEVLAEHFANVVDDLKQGKSKLDHSPSFTDVPGQIAAIRGLFDTLIRVNTDNKHLFIAWYQYGNGHNKDIDALIRNHVAALEALAAEDMRRSGTIAEEDIPVLAQCVISLCLGISKTIVTTGSPNIDDAVLYVMRFTIGGLAGYIGQGENAVKAAQLLSGFMQMAADKANANKNTDKKKSNATKS